MYNFPCSVNGHHQKAAYHVYASTASTVSVVSVHSSRFE